jgi:hypothetical protein
MYLLYIDHRLMGRTGEDPDAGRHDKVSVMIRMYSEVGRAQARALRRHAVTGR